MELIAAARAAHHDVPLTARNADFLVAAGAFINMIILELGKVASKIREAAQKLVLELEKFLIFLISLGDILGEHPPV